MSDSSNLARTATSEALLIRVGRVVCAMPLTSVIEVMRSMPLSSTPGAPAYALGLAVIRGEPVPVIDLGALLGLPSSNALSRFVTLRVGARVAAIAVDDVLGVRDLAALRLEALPPVLDATGVNSVAEVGILDGDLLMVLEPLRELPAEVWDEFGQI